MLILDFEKKIAKDPNHPKSFPTTQPHTTTKSGADCLVNWFLAFERFSFHFGSEIILELRS
jgi:hypothetical protein